MTERASRLPLEGIRVVDLTRVMTGPYCTMMLGDMGADVVKVEMPGTGDDTRAWGPPFVDTESAYYLSVNRNKRSVVLDLKSELGREALWRLIDSADVLVENFSPGTIARLGFGYEAVKTRNPRMVFASISGFGQTGPSAGRTAYDLIVQGMSGMMSITGEKGGRPTKTGPPVADIAAGMFTAYAIASALYGREQTGEGTVIDVSMLAGQIALLTYHAGTYFTNGSIPTAQGNAHAIIVPYDTFPTSDGFVNIAVGNDRLWQRFCEALGMPEEAADPRFATNADRNAHKTALYEALEANLGQRTTAEVVELLDKAGVPCGPIYDIAQVFDDPQAVHSQMRQSAQHSTVGEIGLTGFPYRVGGETLQVRNPPPVLGEQSEDILSELGFTAEEIERISGS
ncbi:MAG TPA: CoA transferase [Thermomicrobiales bacterium]|nr:CoA transferase [Thermomicrobiales bacterium]